MTHNRNQTIKLLKFAKAIKITVEEALVLKSVPIKAVKSGNSFSFQFKESK